MAYKFNPFTDTLDIVGSGGGSSYIDGEVEYHADLPVTVGTPAVNSAFLVRKGQGFYFLTRKPAGIWVRELNNGNLDDWKYAGTFSDLYRDANFRIINDTDTSKELAFSLSGLTTGTTRTLTVPDASGRIQIEGQAIGNTTPAAISGTTGTFTTLTANNGTLTASAPVLDLAQTWNNIGTVFAALNLNVTDTASAANSCFARLQWGGTPIMEVRRGPNAAQFATVLTIGGSAFASNMRVRTGSGTGINFDGVFGVQTLIELGVGTGTGGGDVNITRDAADTLALRRTTNPQTFNIYNTFTSATNYQRLAIKTKAVTLSGLTGASVATTTGLIPDGAVLVGLTTRVSTAITGATGYDIGDGSDADRWGANIGIALNTSSDNTNWTAGTIECFTAAQEVTLTAVGSNFTGGAVVIVAHYLAGEAD
jgi:hypothetical protein